jgi:hypothetical protein
MLLQKRVDLKPGLKTQEPSKLRFPKDPLPETFQRHAFQDMAGDVLSPLLLYLVGNIFGYLDRHFHRIILTALLAKNSSLSAIHLLYHNHTNHTLRPLQVQCW